MRIRTKFIGATDTAGEKIVVVGPNGQRTYSYDYGVYCMHDEAVMRYVEAAGGIVTQDDLHSLPHPRRTLTRSGRGYRYDLPADVAYRATQAQAKAHFARGGTVIVSESAYPTITVHSTTTVHTKESISWEELVTTVDTWRNRHPHQRYFVV